MESYEGEEAPFTHGSAPMSVRRPVCDGPTGAYKERRTAIARATAKERVALYVSV